MATLQIRIDDTLKKQVETFVQYKSIPLSLQQAIYDTRLQRNLYGPFDNAKDAVASMMED